MCKLILWGIFSQCVRISNHHIVPFNYLKLCQLYFSKTGGQGTQSADIKIYILKILLRTGKTSIERWAKYLNFTKKEI